MRRLRNIVMVLIIVMGNFNFLYSQSLEELIKIAIANNPGLKSRHLAFEMSLMKIPQVNALPDPNLSLSYSIAPIETRLGPQVSKLSLSQMFPWFGTLQAKEDVAALYAKSKFQEYLDYRNRIIYELTAAYYPLLEVLELIKIEEENIDILKSYKDIALSKYENAKSSMVDVLRVDIKLNDAITRKNILLKKKKPLLTRINKILNRDEQTNITIKDSLTFLTVNDNYRKDSLLYDNPILSNLDYKVKAAKVQQILEEKKGLPNFGVGLEYVLIGNRANFNDIDNGKDAFMPMLTLSIPIYRDKYSSAKQEAILLEEKFKEEKNQLVNNLIAQYEQTFFELELNRENIELYRQQILETEHALKLLFVEYSNSGENFEEVLRMEQQLLIFKRMLVSSLSGYLVLVSKLDYLTAKY